MRNKLILVAVAAAAALTSTYAVERDALACGGCFHPPPSPTESPTIVTDHRMILTIAKDQSTLYDQIKYQGNPSSFAWVLPISGTVTVGLSADIVFQTLDGLTRTSIVAPPMNCPARPQCNNRNSGFGAASDSSGAADAGASPGGVLVTKQEVVGPYETVQLKATDANALQQWLATNGFSVPADIQPVVDKYVTEKFDFLALKLIPGKSVQDMRPVRVTTTGASAVLPLRMIAAGTGATVGVSLWVLGEGRYEPQNFPSFFIPTTDIAWDWTASKSNYAELRAAKTTASNGRGWETESSTIVSPQQVQSTVTNSGFGGGFRPGPPVPTDGGTTDGGTTLDPAEQAAQLYYDPVKDAQGTVVKTAVQVRTEDMTALFYGIPSASSRVTRMRADLAHAALDADLVMTASADQSVLSNVRQLTKELNEPLCAVYSSDGCSQIGTAPRSDAAARTNGETSESFSCTTAASGGSSPLWLGAGLGYLALAVVRARRRRNP